MKKQTKLDDHPALSTKYLMISSSVFLGMLGIFLSFLPQEFLGYFDAAPNKMGVLLIKITGAMYLGFAVLNWMARANLIGGIYSRPVALGNFFHFLVIAIVLLKFLISHSLIPIITVGTIMYLIFAVCFGYILFAGGRVCK